MQKKFPWEELHIFGHVLTNLILWANTKSYYFLAHQKILPAAMLLFQKVEK